MKKLAEERCTFGRETILTHSMNSSDDADGRRSNAEPFPVLFRGDESSFTSFCDVYRS